MKLHSQEAGDQMQAGFHLTTEKSGTYTQYARAGKIIAGARCLQAHKRHSNEAIECTSSWVGQDTVKKSARPEFWLLSVL